MSEEKRYGQVLDGQRAARHPGALDRGILLKNPGGGRSTSYRLAKPDEIAEPAGVCGGGRQV